MTFLLSIGLFLALLVHPTSSLVAPPPPPSTPFRVAIIGSGVSGSTTAYFLRQLYPTLSSLSLTLYERSPHPGGRVQSVTVDGYDLEAGASIIHHTNEYMKNLSLALNLSVSVAKKDNSRMGIWNSTSGEFVFTTTSSSFYNIVKMIWKFGYSFVSLVSQIKVVAGRWVDVYPLQAQNRSFSTPAALLEGIDLYQQTQQSIGSFLSSLSTVLLTQLVTPVLRVNYNQQLGVNALAGSVGLVPLTDDDVFAIDGGNRQIIEGAIRLSLASLLLSHTATSISFNPSSSSYTVSGAGWTDTYDAVVIAGPLNQTGLQVNLTTPVPAREYKTTVATFVQGRINPAYFGYAKAADVPATILTTDCTGTAYCPFSSFSQYYYNATSDTSVYKLFSSQLLSDEQLDALFVYRVGQPIVYPWKAYPVFHEKEELTEFRLGLEGGGHVWYTNAFEAAVSCMECAAVAAKNVALEVGKEVELGRRAREKGGRQAEEEAGRERVDTGIRPVHLDL